MEDRIRGIISLFVKIPASEIVDSTVIDRSAVGNSIMLHRMYARLAEAGLEVKDYSDIANYGQLMQRIKGLPLGLGSWQEEGFTREYWVDKQGEGLSVGIDIENISSLPTTDDFREHAFYKSNFSQEEIAYCICQSNPYASFAGLFAAKESIIKANLKYRGRPFNMINIDHNENGKPIINGFQVSISHTDLVAVAIAVQENDRMEMSSMQTGNRKRSSGGALILLLSIIAIVVSVISLAITLKR